MIRTPELPQTNEALANIRANSGLPVGRHSSDNITPSNSGSPIFERPYDPKEHSSFLPNPLSVQETFTDRQHVTYRRQLSPVLMDVIVDLDPQERNGLDWITRAKDMAAITLARALANSRLGIGDHMAVKIFGDVERVPKDWLKNIHPEFIDKSDPKDYTDYGLRYLDDYRPAFIIGAWNRDPSTIIPKHNRNIVAVKVSHQFDVKLPDRIGIFATGDFNHPYIDTGNRRQLQAWNEALDIQRQQLTSRLGQAGLSLAEVVYGGPAIDPVYGFSVEVADKSIATATRKTFSLD